MKVRKAFRYRLYPDAEQRHALAIQFGHARYAYNRALSYREAHYHQHGKGIGYLALKRWLTALKHEPDTIWLKEANAQVLQAKIADLDRAYRNFFEGRAKLPTFKSRRDVQTIRYPQDCRFDTTGDASTATRTYLPKVGWVKTVFHRPFEGTPKNVTVTKTKSGRYFMSVLCEVEVEDPNPNTLPGVGVDLGLKHFAVLSTEEKVDNPRHLRRAEERLKRLQRQHSRKKKGSNNQEKARVKLARAYEKVADQRRDFHHKLSRRLVAEHGLVKLENLNVCGMVKNHSLAKSISDAGWGAFGRMVEYKGEWYGTSVERIDRFYPSSKGCSECGLINEKLELHHRFWTCEGCGTEHDRDINASKCILAAPSVPKKLVARTKKTTAGAAGSHACGEGVSREGLTTGARSSKKQEEAHAFRLG